jgi:hypothetical protein
VTPSHPFTSALGPREAFTVAHAGFVPIQPARRAREASAADWNTFGRVPNQELPDWSAGLSDAYALAMRHVEHDAQAQRRRLSTILPLS